MYNEMELVIDNRERELLGHFPDCVSCNLELGDIVIRRGDDVLVVFERKTWSDLAASIKDGRYHNQKRFLMAAHDVSKIYYIIEGAGDFNESSTVNVVVNGIDKSTLLSCVYNTMIRDNIKVFRTVSLADTVELIKGIWKRMSENPDKFVGGTSVVPPSEQIVKAPVSTPEEYFIRALCQVPGISMKTAQAIAKKYRTMPYFVAMLNGSGAEKLKVLKEITTVSNNTRKRISDKVARALLEFIVGDGPSLQSQEQPDWG
jgi:crossover junction endonuclease MUS81